MGIRISCLVSEFGEIPNGSVADTLWTIGSWQKIDLFVESFNWTRLSSLTFVMTQDVI